MLDIDSSDRPFECAAVLPEQFFADRHKFGEPIVRLMFAVLNDASVAIKPMLGCSGSTRDAR